MFLVALQELGNWGDLLRGILSYIANKTNFLKVQSRLNSHSLPAYTVIFAQDKILPIWLLRQHFGLSGIYCSISCNNSRRKSPPGTQM